MANDIYDGPVWLGPQTVEGSLGQMTRALADILTHSAALWWFDICGGWYDRPEYMAFQRRAAEIARASLTDAAERPVSAVCVFVDEDAPNHFAPSAGGTLAALTAHGLTVFDTLQKNDAYHALQAAGGLILTGPTGTNVNDVAVALVAGD